MSILDIHKEFMDQALKLAKKGRGNVSPNPLVGCIIVKNGQIIGEGYHKEYGGNHAEVEAFNNCSESPFEADLYVNLEPCSFHGKTPPCIDRIIENSIKNVYVGIKDKNPEINGKGIEKLKIAGINVYDGILERECYELNKGFFHWIENSRPWVVAKVAQSKNGFISIDSNSRTLITGEDSNNYSHKLRSNVDGILIGKNTALIDNPLLTVRNVIGNNPTRIITDTFRKLPLNLKIFNDSSAENIILCSSEKFEQSETSFCKYLPVKEIDMKLDPLNMLEVLGQNGISSLLIEGGHDILQTFFDNDLINELFLYTSDSDLKNATLPNPIKLNSDWDIIEQIKFENDNLLIARKKELCFQES